MHRFAVKSHMKRHVNLPSRVAEKQIGQDWCVEVFRSAVHQERRQLGCVLLQRIHEGLLLPAGSGEQFISIHVAPVNPMQDRLTHRLRVGADCKSSATTADLAAAALNFSIALWNKVPRAVVSPSPSAQSRVTRG